MSIAEFPGQDGFPSEELEHLPGLFVQETLRHNSEVLNDCLRPPVRDGVYVKEYEGVRCFASPMIIFVDSTSGVIHGVGSASVIDRIEAQQPADTPLEFSEEKATGIARDVLEDPSTARVCIWFEEAVEMRKSWLGVIRSYKPESWARGTRIILNKVANRLEPLEELMPDPIERGILLQSLDEYNQRPS